MGGVWVWGVWVWVCGCGVCGCGCVGVGVWVWVCGCVGVCGVCVGGRDEGETAAKVMHGVTSCCRLSITYAQDKPPCIDTDYPEDRGMLGFSSAD
jgi:hypothetical protein